ncbi:FecR domain-containing protein [Bremerella sp. P1]|uniref:FecR domain-containing protein n=1 Tax=Bremerella sp. P1 TaxID=3026424 RepID=UPI00236769FC|nr:FecR domain-containing protein [Bremerella sp. P1]WDI43827.1 FecR domain-containing protein [Bremerella sp. P1]
MDPTKDNSRLLTLCGKLRDETITVDEFQELEHMLLEQPGALEFYRQFSYVCSGLEQVSQLEQEQVEEDVSTAISGQLPPLPQKSPEVVSSRKPIPNNQSHSLRLSAALVALAASILIVAFVFQKPKQDTRPQLAMLAESQQAVWTGDRPLKLGDSLATGNYSLASGAARLKFSNNAEIIVQAPSIFSIEDAKRVIMQSGSMTLFAPETARSFQIDTPYGSVIDRGTRIGVFADAEEGLEVHVFEGKADAVLPDADETISLSAGEAVVSKSDREPVKRIPAKQEYFVRSLEDVRNLPIVSGDVELLVSPPRSVRRVRSDILDLGRASLFEEKTDVVLDEELPVLLSHPGKAEDLLGSDGRLLPGTKADSFMLHFVVPWDIRHDNDYLTATGSITFNRPVLGVVANNPARLREWFGHPSTDYPGDRWTGLEQPPTTPEDPGDWLELSEDRKTLHFQLSIHGKGEMPDAPVSELDVVDQLRILVESRE